MKIFTGKVISTRDKTAVVAVTRLVAHKVYKKRVKKTKKYQVHDNFGVKVGQDVNFIASKPYSKTKKWKIYFHKDKDLKSKISKSKKDSDKGDSEKKAKTRKVKK